MQTQVFQPNEIKSAAAILRNGGLLGIPTETVYGLGANGLDEQAVRAIFKAKGRPQDNPLILHIPQADWLDRYCQDIPPLAWILAERFWPGPLTIILKRKPLVPDAVTAGLDTVGMRCPDHLVCRNIIEAADVPVAAPSGNTSGRPSPTTAAHMLEDMDGKIDGIVDGGPCAVGVESTILDLTLTPPRLLRPGGITLEQLRDAVGEVEIDEAVTRLLGESERPRAPGMKYRHYAPRAPVTVIRGAPNRTAAYIQKHLATQSGVICFDEYQSLFTGHAVAGIGPAEDRAEQARRIFDALRRFDETDVTEILAQGPDDAGIGLAVSNRLNKAAGFHSVDLSMKRIGITGPTGAGKTTALNALTTLGVRCIDCDAVYHRLLEQSIPLRQALTDRFGIDIADSSGIDRKKLGEIVFQNKTALRDLDEITHRFVLEEVDRQADEAEAAGAPGVAIDAIALVESGIGKTCDAVVGILAPKEQRIRRIMAREGISEQYARKRVDAQKEDGFFRANCDYILENSGEDAPEVFQLRALTLFRQILK